MQLSHKYCLMKKTLFFTLILFTVLTCLAVPTGFAQNGNPDYTARLIYFLPRGNTPRPNIDTQFDEVLKETQKFFADEMERHGYGRKTFKFQTDTHGKAVVQHVTGRFRESHYLAEPQAEVWNEIEGQFDKNQNIHLVVIDTVGETPVCGVGGASGAFGGNLMMHIGCFNVAVTAHEFGHAFGLVHDFRNDAYVMSYGAYRDELSPCHAEWLDAHRYFNPTPTDANQNTEIEMAPPTASPPYAIRFRFTVTDPDGLHQAQLIVPENHKIPASVLGGVVDCHSLKRSSETFEFVTTELATLVALAETDKSPPITLQVIDVDGNFMTQSFPIDVLRLLPHRGVVSIPDTHLAAVVRETLELAPSARIRPPDMRRLISLEAERQQITDLTGLEHAKDLKSLKLGGNRISDVTPLAGLTQLKFLDLHFNEIRDITPLAELRYLTNLNLASNQISDIQPLVALTQLRFLKFAGNPVLDTTPLQAFYQNNPDLLSDADPKIEGPWLWMLVPTDPKLDTQASALWKDYLAAASKGSVTEQQIATKGATTGKKVGKKAWTLGWLPPTGENNINQAMNATGLGTGSIEYHVAYGSITLDSPQEQQTWLSIGSDDNHKVWLNGQLVQAQREQNWAHDYQTAFPVTLKRGKNVLLVAVEDREGEWGGYFGFRNDTVYSVVGETLPKPVDAAEPESVDATRFRPVTEADLRVAGPKIEGPWLWMIVPTGEPGGAAAATSGKDYLAAASKGTVTEKRIATNGATPGTQVGKKAWTPGKLAPTGEDNINQVVNATGLGHGNVEYHVAYGSITLDSPRKQKTRMYVGSDDAVKVWLNGALVHNNPVDRGADNYKEAFHVTLKKGKNLLLVAIYEKWGGWSGFFGFKNDDAYSIVTTPVVHIAPAQRPAMYWIDADAGTLHRLVDDKVENLMPNAKNATSLAVDTKNNKLYWTEQMGKNKGSIRRANLDGSKVQTLTTSSSVLTSIAVDAAQGKLYWTSSSGQIKQTNLNGKQARTLIKNLKSPNNLTLNVADSKLYWIEKDGRIRRANLNGKSIQNIASGLDTISSLSIAGNKIYWTEITGESSGKIGRANLNGSNFGTLARLQHTPWGLAVDTVGSKLYWTALDGNIRRANLNGKKIQKVVSGLGFPAALVLGNVKRGAAAPVNNSLASAETAVPDATYLLPNYPNPFNPETWIPYQLATPSDVKITIYDTRGVVVRHLDLGHQLAGTYTNRTRAAHWDGCNAQGERVASGVYFYQLLTDEISLMRKMVILK